MMDHLPVEIIMHILSYLPIADLIRVSQVNKRISELTSDQQFLRKLDLRRAYTCSLEDLKAFLRPKRKCHLVHSLDMDAVYWFRPPFDVISRMKNLKSLHLRGIPLTLKQLHGLLTAGLPLEELSIDLPKCSQHPMKRIQEMQEGLSNLKFLCVTAEIDVVDQFLRQCPRSLRLIFYPFSIDYNAITMSRRCDTIITCDPASVHPYEPYYIYKMIGRELDEDQDFSISRQVTEVVFDRPSFSDTAKSVATVRSFCNLKGLQILDPIGKLLDLDPIYAAVPELQWLRVYIRNSEKDQWKGCVRSIAALHHLTRLSLPMHILCDTVGTETTFTPSAAQKRLLTPKFKSQRLGANSNVGDAEAGILNFIIDNCPLLTMLEIGVDETPDESLPRNPIYWHSLKNIKKLKRLTHLTLCSIPVTNGEFLREIAIGCPRLKFLRLSNLGPSGKCCYLKELTESVTLMACLTHLSVDQPYMAPGTALFTALKKSQKLLRLSIICHRDMLPVDLVALEQLIQALPSLILLAVMSTSTPQVAFNKLIGKLKKISRPALVVLASKDKEQRPSVPCAHEDMIDFKSWLSGSYLTNSYHQDFPNRHFVICTQSSL